MPLIYGGPYRSMVLKAMYVLAHDFSPMMVLKDVQSHPAYLLGKYILT